MYGQTATIGALFAIAFGLFIGLVVQGVTIYTCIRLALMHHRRMVQREERAAAAEAAKWVPAHPNP